jgi:hypothetical protein
MRKALEDIGYVQTAGKAIRDLVIPAYVESFHSVNSKSFLIVRTKIRADKCTVFSIACSLLAVCAAVITRGGKIERTKH